MRQVVKDGWRGVEGREILYLIISTKDSMWNSLIKGRKWLLWRLMKMNMALKHCVFFFLSFFFHPCHSCHWKCFCWHLFTILLTFIHHITIHHSSLTAGWHRSYKSAVFTKFAPFLFIWMELLGCFLSALWGLRINNPSSHSLAYNPNHTHSSQNKYA